MRITNQQVSQAKRLVSEKMKTWAALSDADLLAEAQKVWKMVQSATRDECMRLLVNDLLDRELPTM
jgi:hypothetical protein